MIKLEEFNANKFNEYQNSYGFYDSDFFGKAQNDVDFYINIIKKHSDEVLELCCGTGRVSIPLAQSGIRVTAVDISNEMLAIFRKKLEGGDAEILQNIDLIEGNMINLSLNKKFQCILIPFRSFLCLTDTLQISQTLNVIFQHLTNDGIFILNLFKPLDNLKETEGEWETKVICNDKGEILYKRKCTNTFVDTGNQIIYYELHYESFGLNIQSPRVTDYLKVKYFYLPQIVDLLENNGFKIETKYYGFDGSIVDINKSADITLICQKKIS